MTERETILAAIATHVESRPGLDWHNYGDGPSYRADARQITRDLHDARTLLAAVRWRGIEAPQLLDALRRNFSGRLSWNEAAQRLDYCTGQYYPTEYRAAACAVLAGALWDYWREQHKAVTGSYEGAGAYVRRAARRELGAGIARRWFR